MDILHSLGIEPKLVITQIIGFAVLLWILNRLLYKPLFSTLAQRQADIKATYDQLDADRKRMEETRREYEQRLAGIETEAREKIQAAVKEAQGLRDSLVEDARTQAETILEQGRNESERDRQKAFLEMRSQIVTLAVAAAGKVINENLTDARQTKLVDDFIGSLGTESFSQAKPGAAAYSSNGQSQSQGNLGTA